MPFFVRLLGGAVFSLGIALATMLDASAAINPGGTVVEYDSTFMPMVWLADVRTVIRNLPVRI